MSNVPSIKGSIFGRAVEDVQKILDDGQLTREETSRFLEPSDLDLLEQTIMPAGWYDVRAYGRLLELLRDVAGQGENLYLTERGKQSAEALLDAGLHQQLEYLNRTEVASATGDEERFHAFGRDLRLLTSLHSSLINFGTQTAKSDPDHEHRYVLEIVDVADYPEPLCWTTGGFINRMAKQHQNEDLWIWERPRRDTVLFRMVRPA